MILVTMIMMIMKKKMMMRMMMMMVMMMMMRRRRRRMIKIEYDDHTSSCFFVSFILNIHWELFRVRTASPLGSTLENKKIVLLCSNKLVYIIVKAFRLLHQNCSLIPT